MIALGLVDLLVITGLMPIDLAFSGFASYTFILILGLLIITAALEKIGTVNMVSDLILRKAGPSPVTYLFILCWRKRC